MDNSVNLQKISLQAIKQVIEEQPISLLFEGVCPTCKQEVKIISIGGTKAALENVNVPERIKPRIWDPTCEYDLGYEFQCTSCQQKFYTERHTTGDWAI